MIAVHTSWLDPKNLNAGWLCPELHFVSCALSFHYIEKWGFKTKLVTNQFTAEIFDKLGLNYTYIDTSLPEFFEAPNIWVLKKMYSYSVQNEPFLHLDTDFYLINPLPDKVMRASLIGQNLEYNHLCYRNAQKELVDIGLEKHNNLGVYAVNMGIVGGNDFLTYKKFYKTQLSYTETHEVCEIMVL